MNTDHEAYVADMELMPAPSNSELEQMLEDMWKEHCDRLEKNWELEQEYKLLTGYWSGRSKA